MKLILLIAFRNLFRQKARSLFMGLGICLGVMIMIIGYSFSKGLSLNIVNKGVEANLFGHFMVNMVEKNDQKERAIIRDRDKMATAIKGHLENIRDVREALTTSALVVGNRQDNSRLYNSLQQLWHFQFSGLQRHSPCHH